jgi:hypothetical protein
MSTPVFDIIQDDLVSVEWLDCRLFMEINPNYFFYVVMNSKNAVVALKYYQLSYNNNQEMVNVLEEIVNDDAVLKERMKTNRVIFNWPENCLVPRLYFDKDMNKDILRLMFGSLNKGLTLSEKIGEGEMYLIYRIPPVLDDFLQRRFAECTYAHYYNLWIDCKLKNEPEIKDQVCIIFNPNEITAAVFVNKQLQVVQNLQYQNPEDIAWQLLNIYRQFNLKQDETPVLVGGMLDQNSAMYEELLKYFQWVELDPMPAGITVPEQFQSFPGHFFSPLLKLALCVS